MNCEWVERQLSAYHDGVLDDAMRTKIDVHLASCTHCSAILDDYARLDAVLAHTPRVEPSAALRARIFDSPEFRAILHGETTPTKTPSRPLLSVVARPRIPAAIVIGLAAMLVVFVAIGFVTITAHNRPADLAITLCPKLAAGQDILVSRSGKTLVSNDGKFTCDAHVQVGGIWSASPDGKWIAYVNETTGGLRVVRSDATNDHAVAMDAGTITRISWAPDGHRFSVIKQVKGQRYSLWLARPEETNGTRYAMFDTTQLLAGPVWSIDGNAAAWSFVPTQDESASNAGQWGLGFVRVFAGKIAGGFSIAFTDGHTGSITDVKDFGLTLASNAAPNEYFLSYVAGPNGTITSIGKDGFSEHQSGETHPYAVTDIQLTAFNSYAGKWALAQRDGTISSFDINTGKVTPLAHIDNVTQLQWSPRGTFLLATSGTTLWSITPEGAHRLTSTLGTLAPVWNNNGLVAFTTDTGIAIFDALGNKTQSTLALAGGVTGIVWSPSGTTLAIWNTQGATLMHPIDGTTSNVTGNFTAPPQWVSTK